MKDNKGKGFPDDQTLKRIREKFSDPKYEGNFALPESASEVDRAKYQLCQLIAKYQREHSLLQKQVAEKLGIDESRISEILRGKIESFTLDRLVSYAEKLYDNVQVKIVAA
ncbi:MAG: XRE family transcriptional regulator [Deltaproteobacteria bacterium]|nr:XRE family transcriptional regulator [Deltaproteobacteria bacterium]MBI3295318.1 XRE family transcriptional regulator [Deltaproteobacteria bacterium]